MATTVANRMVWSGVDRRANALSPKPLCLVGRLSKKKKKKKHPHQLFDNLLQEERKKKKSEARRSNCDFFGISYFCNEKFLVKGSWAVMLSHRVRITLQKLDFYESTKRIMSDK